MLLSLALACWLGSVGAGRLRELTLDLQWQIISAIPGVGPSLIPVMYRLARALTSEIGGTTIGGAIYLWATARRRARLNTQCLYDLEGLVSSGDTEPIID